MNRIILDTDLAMGAGWDIDDGFALALALSDDRLSVDLVTTVAGNTDVESATVLTLELLQRLGRDGIPVFKGAASPLTRPDIVRQPSETTVEQFGHHVPQAGYAAHEIARHVVANPGEITIVAIGPLTNIAMAIALEPRLPSLVKELVVMGGVFAETTGRADMPGEFNVWNDPEATDAVIRSGIPLRFVGLDVTLQVRLTRDDAEQLRRSDSAFASFAGDATVKWIDELSRLHPGDESLTDSCAMHDPLAVAVVSDPDLVTWSPAHVAVVTGESIARGVMVTDRLESLSSPAANCQIATAVDADRFISMFIQSIRRL